MYINGLSVYVFLTAADRDRRLFRAKSDGTSAAPAAGGAGEATLDVGQAEVIGPATGTCLDGVAAAAARLGPARCRLARNVSP